MFEFLSSALSTIRSWNLWKSVLGHLKPLFMVDILGAVSLHLPPIEQGGGIDILTPFLNHVQTQRGQLKL